MSEGVDASSVFEEESDVGRRLIGCGLFLGVAVILFEVAGRLASEQRAGWGWFLVAGMILCGVALNLWSEEVQPPGFSAYQKVTTPQDLE